MSDIGFAFARAWVRDHSAETSLEATARIPLFDGSLALQPDVQYILHPSGVHPNALVSGLGFADTVRAESAESLSPGQVRGFTWIRWLFGLIWMYAAWTASSGATR